MSTLAIRIDLAAALVTDPARSRRAAEILSRPCFSDLGRVSAHRGDRDVEPAPTSLDAIAAMLGDPRNSGVVFDTPGGKKLAAGGEIKNGIRQTNEGATRFYGWLAFPLPADFTPAVSALCDLAETLNAGAGFIVVEPDYQYAQNAALETGAFKMRPGLTTRRLRECDARGLHLWKRHNELAGPEWGTFLGADHLARLEIEKVRASGAFEHVVLVSPRLAYLQITKDPADDLRDDFEAKLQPREGSAGADPDGPGRLEPRLSVRRGRASPSGAQSCAGGASRAAMAASGVDRYRISTTASASSEALVLGERRTSSSTSSSTSSRCSRCMAARRWSCPTTCCSKAVSRRSQRVRTGTSNARLSRAHVV